MPPQEIAEGEGTESNLHNFTQQCLNAIFGTHERERERERI